MRNRRVHRALAVSTIALLAAGTLAMVMRSSEADTPPSSAPANETTNTASVGASTDSGNRICFGSQISSETPQQPIRVGNRFEGYAVRQTAAEEPIAESATVAETEVRASAVPAGSRASADPFGSAVPPVGAMPTPAAPLPPRTPPPSAATIPATAARATATSPASDSRYGIPTPSPATMPAYRADTYARDAAAAPPPANAIPRATTSATASATTPAATALAPTTPMPTASTTSPPAPFAVTSTTAIPMTPPAAREPAAYREPPVYRDPVPAAAPYSAPTAAAPISPPSAPSNARMNSGASVAASDGIGGTGRPGEKALEGTQSPTLTIEKIAPQEIQVGKPALFEIVVRNVGNSTANDVEIQDIVPQGTELKASNPAAVRGKAGELLWLLGAMKPGDEAKVQMELLPTTEGEIGSVATVHFAAAASVRTICTKPELVVEVQMPRIVLAGDDVPVRIRVSNPGTGIATGIFLTEVVPAGLEHTSGGELEYEVGNLQPNESRELELTLKAVKEGSVVNIIQGEGDGTLRSETKTTVEIVAPALTVAIEGPKRRFLDRQATYTVSLANPGTAAAKEVELATFLPKGFQFVEADNHGEYDAATHSVRWLLEELPAKEKGSVSVTTLPIEPGQQLLRVETTAARGVSAKQEEAIMVEGAASIVFQVVDTADPIEVGGEVTYEVVVANQGSKEATNVQLTVALPEGMKALDADGPTKFNIAARQVTFQVIPQLAPKQETTFRVRVQCLAAGDHRCHVQLTSDDMKTPVTKEEGTRVYADE